MKLHSVHNGGMSCEIEVDNTSQGVHFMGFGSVSLSGRAESGKLCIFIVNYGGKLDIPAIVTRIKELNEAGEV